jgi:uncharacterized protein (DUF1778 family)
MNTRRKSARSASPAASEKARRKPDDVRKEDSIRLRCTAEQKRILMEAAEKAGLDVSSWLRMIGIERARELGIT